MSTATDTNVDWERIEVDYRAGLLSLRELAIAHPNTNHVAIARRAKKEGWTRDLTAKIKAKAEDLVTRSVVTPDETARRAVTEKEVVEAGAAAIVQVRLSHRTDIQRSKRLVNTLLEHLEELGLPKVPDKGKPESETQAVRTLCLATLKDQSVILDKLVGTQKVLVAMEREAFGIAQMVEAPDAPAAVNQMDVARRIAFGLARAGAQLPT